MARLAFAAVWIALATPSVACQIRPLPSTESAYLRDFQVAMRDVGVGDVVMSRKEDDRDHFAFASANFGLFITEQDNLISEIGLVQSAPMSASDAERFVAALAFTESRFTAMPRNEAAEKIRADVRGHANGNWATKFGDMVAVFTKTDDGIVAKTGICN